MSSSLKDKRVLVLADKISGSLASTLKRLEMITYLAGRNPKKPSDDKFKLAGTFHLDGDNCQDLWASMESIGFVPDVIFTADEDFIKIKAKTCNKYSIPFIPESHVNRVVEKEEMRRIVRENSPELTPAFMIINSEKDIQYFIEKFGLPVMLKPSGLVRSFLVSKASTAQEALDSFKVMSDRINRLYENKLDTLGPKIIIEEYMQGPKFSVEGVVDTDGVATMPSTVTDIFFGYDVEGINDPLNFLRTLPSELSSDDVSKVKHATQLVVKSLDLKNCPIHAEMIMTKTGVKLIEIAARIGGYREIMYSLSFGYSLIEADFDMQLGRKTKFKQKRSKYSAVIKVYAYEEAKMLSVSNEDKITNLNSYVSHTRKIPNGETVGPSRLGYSEILFVVLCSSDKRKIKADYEYIFQNVRPVLNN